MSMDMKCPTCNRAMKQLRSDTSYGQRQKPYDRVYYQCTYDDIWVTVETPREQEA